jgi:hypothetical protein
MLRSVVQVHPSPPVKSICYTLKRKNCLSWGHSGVTLNCFRLANDLAFPSGVFGPVLIPPWFLHLPLANAFALHGWPVVLANAPHLGISLLRLGGAGLRRTRSRQASCSAISLSTMSIIELHDVRVCVSCLGIVGVFPHLFSHNQLVQVLYLP